MSDWEDIKTFDRENPLAHDEVPDVRILEPKSSHTYEVTPGFPQTLTVFDGDEPIGWISKDDIPRENPGDGHIHLHGDISTRLHEWHDSQWDPIYKVGALAQAGHAIPGKLAVEAYNSLECTRDKAEDAEYINDLTTLMHELKTALIEGGIDFEED